MIKKLMNHVKLKTNENTLIKIITVVEINKFEY